MGILDGVSTFFFDVQGTLLRRDPKTLRSSLIGGTLAIGAIRRSNRKVRVLSNAPRETEEVHRDLVSAGLDIKLEEIITSAQVTGEYILRRFGKSRLYVLGSDSFKRELSKYGHVIVEDDADAVVVGIDRQLNYEKLNRAMRILMGGAKLVAAGMSRFIPEEQPVMSIGPVAVALSYATGVRPIVTGKPSRIMYIHALVKSSSLPEESAIISDDLEDLVYARKFDMRTILVLTGATKIDDLKSFKPDLVLNNVDEIAEYLK